ncbi:hypothetical protein [Ectopseudomonas mendocina]|uniref:Uncharacterized protein n=1 Tax=Ectopseudomonas mendocina S5.2 TaxID=1225174 RepID=A0ABM5W3I9_ECTME|nr:hypothetical protein [Pseudomonas mendocina]ALN21817.1 hypothetical protein DW68_024370 [Pseudomonas mendocina S5.2]KER98128.1 hypothetical protein HN51_25350 [Pseudomonas mendocina]
MRYHAPSKQFTVSLDQLQSCTVNLLFAIKKIREAAGLPLDGTGRQGAIMSDACHAEQAILNACQSMGIDLGATRAGDLDVRNAG